MSEPVIVRDAAGNVLSLRYADGTGWDSTFDKNGNVLSYRHTDGTGWDARIGYRSIRRVVPNLTGDRT